MTEGLIDTTVFGWRVLGAIDAIVPLSEITWGELKDLAQEIEELRKSFNKKERGTHD